MFDRFFKSKSNKKPKNDILKILSDLSDDIENIDDEVVIRQKESEFIQKVNALLDKSFPTLDDLKEHAKNTKEKKYYVLKLLFGFNELLPSISILNNIYIGDKYPLLTQQVTIVKSLPNKKPYDHKSKELSSNYIKSYLKKKSIPGLGKPLTNMYECSLYYKW